MNESTMSGQHFSAAVVLAALGAKLRALDLFGPIREQVHIAQKTVKYTPTEKLYDAFLALLAGAHGLVEINTRLRSDPALQAAVGRGACAEQSVVQDTLDACTEATVAQMRGALDTIYRRFGQGYRHDYAAAWQLLDVDMSGLPCGKKAALASKGYFAEAPSRRGRQLGRVLATRYGEVVVDRLFAGTTQLVAALPALVEAAEQTLELEAAKRARTILRVDGGGGSVDDVNWALARGYHVHGKAYAGRHSRALAASVTTWIADPQVAGRQVGWVTQETTAYRRPVQRIAVRTPKKNGQWAVGVLLSTLPPQEVLALTGQPAARLDDPTAVLLAYVAFYDQRGGGIETAFKEDKQGLGLTKRAKKRFAAQEMAVCLGTLAHNVLVWARRWLCPHVPRLARVGLLRLVRDVLHISGFVVLHEDTGLLAQVVLNRSAPLADGLVQGLHRLLAPEHIGVSLGET
jgi:hypothetical protein